MMKRLLLVLLVVMLTSACSHNDSNPAPTLPAADFPTISPDRLPLCQPTDLDTSANANSAPNEIVMGMTLTNKSKHICTLSNPPKASLLDGTNKPLVAQTTNLPSTLSPQNPALLQLTPGGIVIFTVSWKNYCQTAPIQYMILRLDLSNGQNTEDQINIPATPGCTDKNQPSSVVVGPFSAPP